MPMTDLFPFRLSAKLEFLVSHTQSSRASSCYAYSACWKKCHK